MPKIEKLPETKGAAAPDGSITLDEFCTRLSQTDRRVELIGAFHSVELKAQRTKDAEAAFTARFRAFINAPV